MCFQTIPSASVQMSGQWKRTDVTPRVLCYAQLNKFLRTSVVYPAQEGQVSGREKYLATIQRASVRFDALPADCQCQFRKRLRGTPIVPSTDSAFPWRLT